MNKNCLHISRWLLLPLLAMAIVAHGQTSAKPPLSVSGKWRLSWQARIGMEQGTLVLEQSGTKLNGSFHSELGTPVVSGTMQEQNISFKLGFAGDHPFAIVFTGRVDGNKMNGKFALDGMADGYDQHGENVQPTNYSWKATLLEDHAGRPQEPSAPIP
jgi:hypothetical protein